MVLVPLLTALLLAAPAAPRPPVRIGLDLEAGHRTSTSDDAIRLGARLAVDEVNAAGGVLGGRLLELVERDNRSVPARGVANLRELATVPDLVAVLCGKFSPVALEQVPVARELGVPFLDPWAAADSITDVGQRPSFAFRLSLRDGWAMPVLLEHLSARGIRRVGLLLPLTSWGRSSHAAAEVWLRAHPEMRAVSVQWFSWGEATLAPQLRTLREAGAQGLLLVANEEDGALLVRDMAALPRPARLPIASHWGIAGGDFAALAGPALKDVELAVVQTFSFAAPRTRRGAALGAAARRAGVARPEALPSATGVAHAYDLVHLLARAVDRAGSTDHHAIRAALEHLPPFEGAVRRYRRPFAPDRHEALGAEDLFMAAWDASGILRPVRGR
jgi:branched-chain amino acid transport system substrate-binding protein